MSVRGVRGIRPSRRTAALLSLLGAALACAGPSRRDAPPVAVRVALTGRDHAVELVGLDRAVARDLARLAPNDVSWRQLMAVYVELDTTETAARAPAAASRPPPVIGRYTAAEHQVRFEPRFPFVAGVAYRVDVDTAALVRLARRGPPIDGDSGRALLTHRFSIPTAERKRDTRVLAVHPSATRLPSNLLRWYVELSAPMAPGNALAHVRLKDESGREVRGAFLALDQELWDPERRRLTLLLDPGRVKRGVRTNLESGAPLVAGRRYTLVIDGEWRDGTGAPLASGYEHAFEVIAADRESPDPHRWLVTVPRADSRDDVVVAFGEPLDHALAGRMLSVHDASGALVTGSARLAEGDSVWSFAPSAPWTTDDYTIRVRSALEDVAGNSIARVFDTDRRADGGRDGENAGRDSVSVLRFTIGITAERPIGPDAPSGSGRR